MKTSRLDCIIAILSVSMAMVFVACSNDDEPTVSEYEKVARSNNGEILVDDEVYYYHNNCFNSYYEIDNGILASVFF